MRNNLYRLPSGLKLFLIIFSVVAVLSSLFYLLIFSTTFANFKPIIVTRTNYIPFAFKVRSLLGMGDTDNYGYLKSPIRTLNTFENSEFGYKYLYTIIGKLVAVDPANGTMTLKVSDNKEYVVSVKMEPVESEQGWYSVKGIILGKDTKGSLFYFYPADLSQSVIKDGGFSNGQQYYTIYWRDGRPLKQILKEYKQNPKDSINLYPNGVMFLGRSK